MAHKFNILVISFVFTRALSDKRDILQRQMSEPENYMEWGMMSLSNCHMQVRQKKSIKIYIK